MDRASLCGSGGCGFESHQIQWRVTEVARTAPSRKRMVPKGTRGFESHTLRREAENEERKFLVLLRRFHLQTSLLLLYTITCTLGIG